MSCTESETDATDSLFHVADAREEASLSADSRRQSNTVAELSAWTADRAQHLLCVFVTVVSAVINCSVPENYRQGSDAMGGPLYDVDEDTLVPSYTYLTGTIRHLTTNGR